MRPATPLRAARCGATLPELTVVCAVIGLVAAIGVPRVRLLVDRLRVRGAVEEIAAACATARHLAVLRSQPATFTVDAAAGTVAVALASDTVVHRDLGGSFGVTLAATRDTVTYSPTGLTSGVSNLSIAVTRGRAADTLFVSRLGRVRR